jgi:hypothetical protein
VWGYALIWFLLSDRIKLLAYRIIDLRAAASGLLTITAAEESPT